MRNILDPGKHASLRKSSLAKSSWYSVIIVALLVCGVVLWRQKSLNIIYLDKQPIIVELATTRKAREQGLSYRQHLANGHGMLFDFSQPSEACMWAKDMNFPIDVYWYSAGGNLVGSQRNVSPDSFPQLYCPELPASYMLEVNVGQLKKLPKTLVPPANQ